LLKHLGKKKLNASLCLKITQCDAGLPVVGIAVFTF
jgi:hypothetical protein